LTQACGRRKFSREGALTIQHTCWGSGHVRCLFILFHIGVIPTFAALRRREIAMSYIVYIKQLATGIVRTRVEDNDWNAEDRLWIRGSRACDCARALLFAQDQEAATCPCGISAYAIRVDAADGTELYCEEEFEPQAEEFLDSGDAQADIVIDSPASESFGAFARHALDRLAVQITQYTGMQAGRHDQG
jgi:hypothetical protein